jgi:hypothetical protein
MQSVESRGIDPGQDLLQIFAGPFELNFGETGEDRACRRRRTDVGFLGQGEVWVSKMKAKELEAGQRREAGGHRLGWNVPGPGEYHEGEDRRGEWQTKVGSVIPEMERLYKSSDRRRGAVPPKNESGSIGPFIV